jgi:hypothetical protein
MRKPIKVVRVADDGINNKSSIKPVIVADDGINDFEVKKKVDTPVSTPPQNVGGNPLLTGQNQPQGGSPQIIPSSNTKKAVQSIFSAGIGLGNTQLQPKTTVTGKQATTVKGDIKASDIVSKPSGGFMPKQTDFYESEISKITAQRDAEIEAAKKQGMGENVISQISANYETSLAPLRSNLKSESAKNIDQNVSKVIRGDKVGDVDLGVVSRGGKPVVVTESEVEKTRKKQALEDTEIMGNIPISDRIQPRQFSTEMKAFELDRAQDLDNKTAFLNTNIDEWARLNPVDKNVADVLKKKQKEVATGGKLDLNEVQSLIDNSISYNNEIYEAGLNNESMEDFSFRKKKETAEDMFSALPSDMQEFNKELFGLNVEAREYLDGIIGWGAKYNENTGKLEGGVAYNYETGEFDYSQLSDQDRARIQKEVESRMGEYNSKREKMLSEYSFGINNQISDLRKNYTSLEKEILSAEKMMRAETDQAKRAVYAKHISEGRQQLNSLGNRIGELNKSKTSFLSTDPKKLAGEIKSSKTVQVLMDALPSDLSAKEKFDMMYRQLYKKNQELMEKEGIDQGRLDGIGQNIRDWLDIDVLGLSLSPEEKEYLANKRLLIEMSPIYFNNASSVGETGGFFESFMNGFANTINKTTTTKRSATSIGATQLSNLEKFGISTKDATNQESLKMLEERVQNVPWNSMETMGEALGTTSAIMADMVVGGAILAPLKGVKAVKSVIGAYDKAMDASKLGRYLKPAVDNAVQYELTGQIIGSVEDEMNAEAGFLGTIGGGLVGSMFQKLGSEKLATYIAGAFGGNSERALNVMKAAGQRFNSGVGEIGEEFTQELVGIYNDELRDRGFWEEVESRYGNFNNAMKLAVTSFIMGAGMGHNVKSDSYKKGLTEDEVKVVESVEKEFGTDVANATKEAADLSSKIQEVDEVVDSVDDVATDTTDATTTDATTTDTATTDTATTDTATTDTATDTATDATQTDATQTDAPKVVFEEGVESKYQDAEGRFFSEDEVLAMDNEVVSGLTMTNPSEAVQQKIGGENDGTIDVVADVDTIERDLDLTSVSDEDLDVLWNEFTESTNPDIRILSNMVENVQEQRERFSILNSSLDAISDLIDNITKKSSFFIEKREAREAKSVADKYLGDVDKNEAVKDFKDAFFGNPDKWVADALKMRESVRVYIEKGGSFKELLSFVQKEFEGDGFTEQEAASVINSKMNSLTKKDFRQNKISQAYIKSKKDGSNPELVEAVEKLLEKNQVLAAQTEVSSNAKKVEDLRTQEQEELKMAFPNAELKEDGTIDVEKLSAEDSIKYGGIYMKYDKLITPLLDKIDDAQTTTQTEIETQTETETKNQTFEVHVGGIERGYTESPESKDKGVGDIRNEITLQKSPRGVFITKGGMNTPTENDRFVVAYSKVDANGKKLTEVSGTRDAWVTASVKISENATQQEIDNASRAAITKMNEILPNITGGKFVLSKINATPTTQIADAKSETETQTETETKNETNDKDEAKTETEAIQVGKGTTKSLSSVEETAKALEYTDKETPSIKKFFNTVYHATKGKFNDFSSEFLGVNTGAKSAKEGFFFATNKDVATSYASKANDIFDQLLKAKEVAEKKVEDAIGMTLSEFNRAIAGKWRVDIGKTEEEIEKNTKIITDANNALNRFANYELEFMYEPTWNENTLSEEGELKEVVLTMKNPFVYDFKGGSYNDKSFTEIIKEAKNNGNDSVILKNTYDGNNPYSQNILTDINVVFSSKQIKDSNIIISESYHAAKAKPESEQTAQDKELVKAVEELLSKEQSGVTQTDVAPVSDAVTETDTTKVAYKKTEATVDEQFIPTTSNIKSAKKVGKGLVTTSGKLAISGNANGKFRQRIIEVLTGKKLPLFKATATELRKVLISAAEIDAENLTDAGIEKRIIQWINSPTVEAEKETKISRKEKLETISNSIDSFSTNPMFVAMEYLANGGKITVDAIQKLYGRKGGGKKIGGEVRARLSMIDNNKGISLDRFYEMVGQSLIDAGIENVDINEVMDVVNTVISENSSRNTVIDSLYDMVSEENAKVEKEMIENTMGKAVYVFEKAITKLDELEKQLEKFGRETMGVSIPIPVLRGALKAAKKTLELTSDSIKMIESAIDYIKDTKWYESLSNKEKNEVQNDVTAYFNQEKELEDLVGNPTETEQGQEAKKSTVGETKTRQSKSASRVINLPKDILKKLKAMTEYDVTNREKLVNEITALVRELGAETAYEYAKSETEIPFHVRGAIVVIAGNEMTSDAISMRNEAEKKEDSELLAMANDMLERASFIIAEGSLMGTDAGKFSSLFAEIYERYPLFYNASVFEKEGGFSGPNRRQQQSISEFQNDVKQGVDEVVDEELTDEVISETIKKSSAKSSDKTTQKADREKKEKEIRKRIEDAKKKFFGSKTASVSLGFLSNDQIEAIGEMVKAYLELGTMKATNVVNKVYRELVDFDSRIEKKHILSIARDLAEFESKMQAEKNEAELKRIEKLKKRLEDLKNGKEDVLDREVDADSDEVRRLKNEIEEEKVLKPAVLRKLVKDYMKGNMEGFSSLASAIAIKTGLDPLDAQILAGEIEAKLKAKVEKMVAKKIEKFIEKNSEIPLTTSALKKLKANGEATQLQLEELQRRLDTLKSQRESEQIMTILSNGKLSENTALAKAFENRFGYKMLSPETKKRIDAIVVQINELQNQVTKQVTKSNGKVVTLNTTQRLRIKRLQSQMNTILDTQKSWSVARIVKLINSAFYIGALSGALTLVRATQGGYITSLFGGAIYTATNIVYVQKGVDGKRQLKFGGMNLLRAMVEAGKSGSAAWQRAMIARKTGTDTFGDSAMKGDASSDTKDFIERNVLLGLGDAVKNKRYGSVVGKTIGQVLKGVHILGALDSFLNTAFGNYVGVNEFLKEGGNIEDIDADLKEIANDEFSSMIEKIRREVISEGFSGDIEKEVDSRMRKELGIQGSRFSAKKVYTTTRTQELRENQRYDAFQKGVSLAKYYSMISEADGVFGWLSAKAKQKMTIKDDANAMEAIVKGVFGSLFRFINMTGNSVNMVATNIPVFGIVPALVGMSKNEETGDWKFGFKYKTNPLLVQQRIASNLIVTSVVIAMFADMFDEDEEGNLILNPDRSFDIRGFGETGMGGAKKNERKFEDWKNLSISFGKDENGNFTNYVSVKLIPPMAAMVASLSTWSDPMNHYKTWTDESIGQVRLDDLRSNPFSVSNISKGISNNIQVFMEQPFSSIGRMVKNFNAGGDNLEGLQNMISGYAVDNLKPIINPSSIQSITRTIQKYADVPQKDAPGIKQLVNNLYGLDAFLTNNKTDVFGNTYPEVTDYERFLDEFLGKGEKRSEKIRNIELLYKFGEGVNITKKNFSQFKKKSDKGFVLWDEKYISMDDNLVNEVQDIQEAKLNEYVNEMYEYLNSIETKLELEKEMRSLQDLSVEYAKEQIVEKYEKTNKIKKLEK